MISNLWKKVLLGDCFDLIPGYAFKSKEFLDQGIPVLKIKNIKPISVKYEELAFVDPKFLRRKDKYIAHKEDLLISMSGNRIDGTPSTWVGKVACFNKTEDYFVNQRVGILRKKSSEYDSKFFTYLLSTFEMQYHFISIATSSGGQANISPDQIKNTKLNIPTYNEQIAISDTLSCLDNMIELNNRTNKVLEEMAKTIFKQWFIDFDFPNENGEPYKSSGGEMVDSELGLIPIGWCTSGLLEIADYINGLAMQRYRPKDNEAGIPVLKIKELRQQMVDHSSELCSEKIDSKYIINDGDMVFSWSGSLLVDFWCGGKCGLNQHLFKVISQKYDKWFYYFWTVFHLQKFIGIAQDKATTMGHIKREDLARSLVLIPDGVRYKSAAVILEPIIDMIIKNRIECRMLSETRDLLLPKLMSGEIRIPIEEVV